MSFEGKPLLIEVLRQNNIAITAPCGGNGRCGRCLVSVFGEVSEPDAHEISLLAGYGYTAQRNGIRLACRTQLLGNSTVQIVDNNPLYNSDETVTFGNVSTFACDRVINRNILGDNRNQASFPQSEGSFPQLPIGFCGKVEKFTAFAVFDLGTTTISLNVYTADGRCSALTELNSQRSFGADVISRVSHSMKPGGLAQLTEAVRSQCRSMLSDACCRLSISISDIEQIAVAANTVMQHIFAGLSPERMSAAPYIPDEWFGRVFTLDGMSNLPCDIYILPCSGGFTGGDLTGCLTAYEYVRNSGSSFPHDAQKWEHPLIVDLGTNGELALLTENGWLVTSSAAGPALEGGSIECGTGIVSGAVDRVYRDADGAVRFDTIGGGKANGITGCALLELLTLLLDEGIVDETGRMETGRYELCEGVYLTQGDIRAIQLAKGAVRAAAERLLEIAGIAKPDGVVITGGLGYRIPPEVCMVTGLLPMPQECENIVFLPAMAIGGACLCVADEGRSLAESIVRRCKVIELGGDERFNQLFIEHMEFDYRG